MTSPYPGTGADDDETGDDDVALDEFENSVVVVWCPPPVGSGVATTTFSFIAPSLLLRAGALFLFENCMRFISFSSSTNKAPHEFWNHCNVDDESIVSKPSIAATLVVLPALHTALAP